MKRKKSAENTEKIHFFLGRPHAAKIVSPKQSNLKDQYNLTWTVDSFMPIEEYRILYRVFSVSHDDQE